jgi:ABC-2 type transport system ATP-binding protein
MAMRAVFGLLEPDAGELLWDGRPVGLTQRLRFGYMPEERGLYPRMPLAEQLVYFGSLHGLTLAAARAATSEWLARLGLADRSGANVKELSHGNQQRAQLAAAMLHKPELLVFDGALCRTRSPGRSHPRRRTPWRGRPRRRGSLL